MCDVLLPRHRQEGDGASPGAGAGQPDQAQAVVPDLPQQHQEGGRGRVQAEEGGLCVEPEEHERRAGEAAQGEAHTLAGSEAVQEARVNPEAAERRILSRGQRHAGPRSDGGDYVLFDSDRYRLQ